MKKKRLGFLLLLPAGMLLAGCEENYKCSGGSGGGSPKYFDVQGVGLEVSRLTLGPAPASGELVAATDILLEVELQVSYYGYSPPPSSWLPMAYACPPAPMPGYMGSNEVLDSLVVRSVYAYDATHPAGSVVNDLLVDQYTGTVLPPVPAPNTGLNMSGLRLRPQRSPAQPGSHQFLLRYRLTNGEIYTARTPVLTLR